MRRVLASLAATLVVVGMQPARAAEPARALDAAARASVLVAQIDVQPAFDPAFADSRASSSTIGTTSLQSVVWPSFLVDAFFFLYGFQVVERLALGIAEARWPQGPTKVDATQSNLLFSNGGDPDTVPGKGGRAVARAAEDEASGDVAWSAISLPGVGEIGAARSDTAVTTDGNATSISHQEVVDLAIGPLTIDVIRGEARTSSEGEARASLEIVGARVAGQEVLIDDEGVRALTAGAQDVVDAALAGSGLTVSMVPETEQTRGSRANASSGGVLVRVEGEGPDANGGTRSVVLGMLFGAADASARAVTIGAPPEPRDEPVEGPGITTCFCGVDLPPAPAYDPVAPQLVRRTIITTLATGTPIGARGAYAAVMLVGLGLLLIRPLVRAAARP